MQTKLLALLCLTSLPAAAWEARTDSEGDVVRWTTALALVLDSRVEAQLQAVGATQAIGAAVEHLDAATPQLKVSMRVGAAAELGYVASAGNLNQNSILALEDWPYSDSALAVTLVTLNVHTNQVLDADIAFNLQEHRFRVLPSTARDEREFDDVQNTITHELGHVLGLMHNAAAEDIVMYPSAPPGELSKRTLKADDLDGLLSLYGTAPEPQAVLPGVGCSSTSGAPVSVLLLLALLVLRRGRPTTNRLGLALAALVPAVAAAAEPMPLAVSRAQSVAMVEVTSRRSFQHPRNPGLIITELSVVSVECLKGPCAAVSSVVVGGGRIGDIEQVVVHEPVAVPGERLLLTVTAGQVRVLHVDADVRLQIANSLRGVVRPEPQSSAVLLNP